MTAKILVVDDDTGTANLFQLAMTKLGYDAVIKADVPSAKQFLEKTIPEIILLDIMLPGQSGLDLLVHVRQTPTLANVFVVITSAHAFTGHMVPSGVEPDIVLRKPIRLPELRQVISKALA